MFWGAKKYFTSNQCRLYILQIRISISIDIQTSILALFQPKLVMKPLLKSYRFLSQVNNTNLRTNLIIKALESLLQI